MTQPITWRPIEDLDGSRRLVVLRFKAQPPATASHMRGGLCVLCQDATHDEEATHFCELPEFGGDETEAPEFTPPPGELSGCRCPDCPEKRTPKRECFCCAERRSEERAGEVEPII